MRILPSFERSKFLSSFVLWLVGTALISVGAYAFLVHSEPYEFGTHFVSTDARVTDITGVPSKTELRVLRGFRFSFGDSSGNAAMTIRSLTGRGSYDVELSLEKRAGRWLVERAHVYPPKGTAITVVDSACTGPCS